MKAHTPRFRFRREKGLTLPEVMIAMFVITFICLSAFALMLMLYRQTLADAYTAEAHRLIQQKVEELRAVSFKNFVASPDESIVSAFTNTTKRNTLSRFSYSGLAPENRVNFTRAVTLLSETAYFSELLVRVSWNFNGRGYQLSVPIARATDA